MLVLALDTSSARASLAVVRIPGGGEAEVLAETWIEAPEKGGPRHGEQLFPQIDSMLATAGVDKCHLELIAAGVGPGSFTGVRVGLSTAKGIALGLGIPFVGARSCEVLAAGVATDAQPGDRIATLIDAFKGEVFLSVYVVDERGVLRPELDPVNLLPDEAKQRLCSMDRVHVLGQGVRKYADAFEGLGTHVDAEHDSPSAATLAVLATARFRAEGPSSLAETEPLYVRGADAKLPDKPLKLA